MSYQTKFEKLQSNPSIKNYVKEIANLLDDKDPVDVLNGLERLTELFKKKLYEGSYKSSRKCLKGNTFSLKEVLKSQFKAIWNKEFDLWEVEEEFYEKAQAFVDKYNGVTLPNDEEQRFIKSHLSNILHQPDFIEHYEERRYKSISSMLKQFFEIAGFPFEPADEKEKTQEIYKKIYMGNFFESL